MAVRRRSILDALQPRARGVALVLAASLWAGGAAVDRAGAVSACSDCADPSALSQSITRVAAGPNFSVAVEANRVGPTIPADFVGASFETEAVGRHLFVPSGPLGAGLLRLYHGLGPNGVLRIGGAAADRLDKRPSSGELKALGAFVQALGPGWSLIWGLDFQHGNAPADAAEAKNLADALGVDRVVFQIGNEPDMYPNHEFSAYARQWEAVYAAVTAMVPGARFAGPDAAGTDDRFIRQFANTLGPRIVLFSEHKYGAGTHNPNPDIVLKALENPQMPAALREGAAVAREAHKPARLTESGSIAGVGPEVAGTLGAAVFDVWEMMTLAENGWAGVNFHGGTSGGYSPQILQVNVWKPQGTLYAMMLFEHLAGARVVGVRTNASADFPVLAAVGTDGGTRVLLLNKSPSEPAQFTVTQSTPWASASVLLMSGPGYSSTDISINQARIGADGSLNARPVQVPRSPAGAAVVAVPPSSAAVVTLNAR